MAGRGVVSDAGGDWMSREALIDKLDDAGVPEASAAEWVDRLLANAAASALEASAREHEAQLVCCDVFDRLGPGDGTERRAPWTDEERREYRHHDICYWGAACAEGDRARAREIREGA